MIRRSAFVALCMMMAVSTPAMADTRTECQRIKPAATDIAVELFMPEQRFANDLHGPAIVQGSAQNAFTQWANTSVADPVWVHADSRLSTFNGLALNIQTSFETDSRPVDQFGTEFCPFVTSAQVDILALGYASIPQEHKPDSCRGQTLAEHEVKHYQVNQYVLQQAVEKLRRDLPRMIRDLEAESLVPAAERLARGDSMKQTLQSAVEEYMSEEVAARLRTLNRQVDTLVEYERIKKLTQVCDIKDALARDDKDTAMELMRKFKAQYPDAAPAAP